MSISFTLCIFMLPVRLGWHFYLILLQCTQWHLILNFHVLLAVLENGLEQAVRQKCLTTGMCLSQNHSQSTVPAAICQHLLFWQTWLTCRYPVLIKVMAVAFKGCEISGDETLLQLSSRSLPKFCGNINLVLEYKLSGGSVLFQNNTVVL